MALRHRWMGDRRCVGPPRPNSLPETHPTDVMKRKSRTRVFTLHNLGRIGQLFRALSQNGEGGDVHVDIWVGEEFEG